MLIFWFSSHAAHTTAKTKCQPCSAQAVGRGTSRLDAGIRQTGKCSVELLDVEGGLPHPDASSACLYSRFCSEAFHESKDLPSFLAGVQVCVSETQGRQFLSTVCRAQTSRSGNKKKRGSCLFMHLTSTHERPRL